MSIKPKIKKINEYNRVPDTSITNEYPTSKNSLTTPFLMLVVGGRNTGKSYTTAKILQQSKLDKTYDRYFMITSSYQSNKKYWDFLDMNEEDIFLPSHDSVDKVIEQLEFEAEDWSDYILEKELYDKFVEQTKNAESLTAISEYDLQLYQDAGFINNEGDLSEFEPPKWKYEMERPAQTICIFDDILGSAALANSKGLTKMAIMNRHIAPLSEPYKNRSAVGCACIFLTQQYSGGGGGAQGGIPRGLRLNATHLVFFENKSSDVMKKILEELNGAIDEEEFINAYKYAIKEKHDNLMVDLHPKCPKKRYRRNLSQFIVYPSQETECICHLKK